MASAFYFARTGAERLLFLGKEGELGGLAITGNTVPNAGKLAFRISRLSAAARFEGNRFAEAGMLQCCRVGEEETDVASLVASGRLSPGNSPVPEMLAR